MGQGMDATHAFRFTNQHKQRDRWGVCQRLRYCRGRLQDLILAGWRAGVVWGDDPSPLTTLIKRHFLFGWSPQLPKPTQTALPLSYFLSPSFPSLLLPPSGPAVVEVGVHTNPLSVSWCRDVLSSSSWSVVSLALHRSDTHVWYDLFNNPLTAVCLIFSGSVELGR